MSDELKPCPFCGETRERDGALKAVLAYYVSGLVDCTVGCERCGMFHQTSQAASESEARALAIAAWNRRFPDARIAELEHALLDMTADRDSWEQQASDRVDDVLRVAAESDKRIAELEAVLASLRRGHMDYDGDVYHSCPRSDRYLIGPDMKQPCDCGADEWNARIDALIGSKQP